MTGSRDLTLARIRVYPLKGAAGFDLTSARPDGTGIPGDRRWMVVRPDGVFLSQRTQPRLALVRTSPVPSSAGSAAVGTEEETARDPSFHHLRFQIQAPGMEAMVLESIDDPAAPEMDVFLWGAHARGRVVEEAGTWFSDFLGQECRVLFSGPGLERPVDPAFAPGHRTGFSDGFPFLLATEESLADLNRHLRRPVSMLRFRPNLVVSGGAPWEEDGWRVLETGGLQVALVKPCARCAVTTVDPGSATRGPEPLKTLRSIRGWEGKAFFGQNAVIYGSGGFRVGERVRIVEKGPLRPPLG